MTSEAACHIVNTFMRYVALAVKPSVPQHSQCMAKYAAKMLVDLAVKHGSNDNVTALVIFF